MSAILPVYPFTVHESQIDLVDKGSGLKGVVRAFSRHAALGHAMELLVHQGREFSQGLLVSLTPSLQ
jgi:hypothetical protein